MDFSKMLFRCHSLSNIMSPCKDAITEKQLETLDKLIDKGDKLTSTQKAERTRLQKKKDSPPYFDLSEGAKTFVQGKVEQIIFKYKPSLDTKQLQKGIMCEPDAIDLFNDVRFTRHKKNEVRLTNDWITGECDILVPDTIIYDLKTSWSKATFPVLPEQINVGGYEWQGRGYMMLYNVPKFELVYALVDTPDELLDWEDPSLHLVEYIPAHLRITSLSFDRCEKKEVLIKHKVQEARKYAQYCYDRIMRK